MAEGETPPPTPAERDTKPRGLIGMIYEKALDTQEKIPQKEIQEQLPEEDPVKTGKPQGGISQIDKSKDQDQTSGSLEEEEDDQMDLLIEDDEAIDEESPEKHYKDQIPQKIPQKSIPEKQGFFTVIISKIEIVLLKIKALIWGIITYIAKFISNLAIYFLAKIM